MASAPLSSSSRESDSRLSAGPGHQHPFAPQGPVVEPPKPLPEPDHLAYDGNDGRPEPGGGGLRFDVLQGAHDGLLVRLSAPSDQRRWGIGLLSVPEQRIYDGRKALPRHQQHQGAGAPRQGLPVNWRRVTAGSLGPGHHGKGGGDSAVGQRDPGVCRRRDGRGDARHDLEGHARLSKGVGLLAAAPEYEGVASLQTDYLASLLRPLDEKRVDLRAGFFRPGRGPCRRR